jgi:hypothetical protein
MTWFVLLAATSWNLLSYLVLTLSGLVLAVLVTGLLFARGDRGVAVGLVVAAGTAAALLFLAAWIGWNG